MLQVIFIVPSTWRWLSEPWDASWLDARGLAAHAGGVGFESRPEWSEGISFFTRSISFVFSSQGEVPLPSGFTKQNNKSDKFLFFLRCILPGPNNLIFSKTIHVCWQTLTILNVVLLAGDEAIRGVHRALGGGVVARAGGEGGQQGPGVVQGTLPPHHADAAGSRHHPTPAHPCHLVQTAQVNMTYFLRVVTPGMPSFFFCQLYPFTLPWPHLLLLSIITQP